MNLLNYFTVLLILGGTDYLTGFNHEQLNGLVLLFLNAHKSGYDLGLVFFGFHCLVLGYLLFKSDYFPKLLGILVGLASLGYLTNSFTSLVFPNYAEQMSPVLILPVIAEFSLCLWLLITGVKVQPE